MSLALGSCRMTEPSSGLPYAAIPLAAPAVYRDWFRRTEACAGLSGSFEAIQWFVVPGVDTFPTSQGLKVGMWSRSGGRETIVIAGNWMGHEMVIRHEMLHSLLGEAGHPDRYFGERCQLTWETWPGA